MSEPSYDELKAKLAELEKKTSDAVAAWSFALAKKAESVSMDWVAFL